MTDVLIEKYSDCSNIPNYELFQTGDILLFSDREFIPSILIEEMTHSKYSHVGIILRDPKFPHESLEGLYILESTGYIKVKDVENHKYKVGVQINKLSDVYNITEGNIYWRRLTTDRDTDFDQIISEVHKLTHDKGYDFDPGDWVKAYFDWHIGNEQKENEFICSALVAFLYDRLGFLTKPVEWTIVRPVDWGTEYPESERRVHIDNCVLDPEIQIRFFDDKKDDDDNQNDKTSSYWSYLYAPFDMIRNYFSRD